MSNGKGNREAISLTPDTDPGQYGCPRCGNLTADADEEHCYNCGRLEGYCPYCRGAGGWWGGGEWSECEMCDGTGERGH